MTAPLEAALARHRAITVVALVLLTVLAWAWLVAGASHGMEPLVSLAPAVDGGGRHQGLPMDMAVRPGGSAPGGFVVTFIMWWVMMVAMMLPAAAPVVLLFARVAAGPNATAQPATGSFLAGYLMAWGLFALAASLLQQLLVAAGLLAPLALASLSPWLSTGVLGAAGLYQLSPAKGACLRRCRHPAQVISRHYRPAAAGAVRMGAVHGAFCVGCCWLLMVLLFVGGVMNLAWIALLTVVVAAEKLLPRGRAVSLVSGGALLVWAVAVAVGAAGLR